MMLSTDRINRNPEDNREVKMTTLNNYSFHGVMMTQVQFAAALAKKGSGQCPFCNKRGFTDRYGSFTKHLRACAALAAKRARVREMKQDEHKRNCAEAQTLINQALTDLSSESAIWRLVDAVGLLSEYHKTAIGRYTSTGRGYRIRHDSH